MVASSRHRSPNTILVVSDLHLTSGINAQTGRWSPTEDFFWDEEFRDFLTYHTDRSRCTLVINGDWFDFLQVLVFPTDDEKRRFGIDSADIDRVYGLGCSEPACVFEMAKMLGGHPVLFDALGDFLAGGNELKIVKGNHDVELFWPAVQELLRSDLLRRARRTGKRVVPGQIEFLPWIFYVPGRLYVEHGNQYEPTCAFRNFLFPMLPFPYAGGRDHLELDLSGLLVRYLTNRIEPIFPLADNVRPLTDVYVMLWKNHPWLAARTFGKALRFVLKAFAKARALQGGAARQRYIEIRRENARLIDEQAQRFSGGAPGSERRLADALHGIHSRAPKPTFEQGAWRFLRKILWATIRRLVWLLPVYVLTLIPGVSQWVVARLDALDIPWLSGAVHFLEDVNVFQILLLAIAVVVVLAFRHLVVTRKRQREDDAILPDVGMAMRRYARHIADTLDVPFVTFGHTHSTDVVHLDGGRKYFNTGTWMTTISDDDPLVRGVREFTFLKVSGNDAVLLHWDPEREEPRPVIVVETQPLLSDVEDSLLKVFLAAFKR